MQEPAAEAAPEEEAQQTAEAEAAAEAEAEAEGAPDQAQQQAEAQQEEAAEQQQAAQQEEAAPQETAAEETAAEETTSQETASQETASQETGEARTEEAGGEQAGETQQAAADAGAQPEYIQMVAAADPAAGEGAVRACMACHSFNEGGPNKVGPNLWDIVGTPIAHDDSFNYSQVFQEMKADGMAWTYENLWAYLKNPREWAPGTKMAYAGVRQEQTKAEIIAYLRSLSNDPAPLEPLQ
jgi:cytochrome c2